MRAGGTGWLKYLFIMDKSTSRRIRRILIITSSSEYIYRKGYRLALLLG